MGGMQVIVKKTTKKNGDLPEPECRPGPVGANSAMRTVTLWDGYHATR